MKKIFYYVIIPIIIFGPLVYSIFNNLYSGGNEISDYYMEVNIKENGNVNIRELRYLNGSYNGLIDTYYFDYKDNYINVFNGEEKDLKSSKIYNGESIKINEVKLIDKSFIPSYNDINKSGIHANKASYAINGANGVYTVDLDDDRLTTMIYNRTSKGFYTDYTIQNMSIKHNDVSELAINLFTGYRESIDKLIIMVNIPSNKNMLKIYGHGWNNSSIKIIDSNTAKITVRNLPAYNNFDARVVFDSDALTTSKITKYNVLDKIDKIETELLNEQEINYSYYIVRIILYICYVFTLLLSLKKLFIKKDKVYNRNLPSDDALGKANYIMTGIISEPDFYASILNLVVNKVITLEKIDDDYLIHYTSNVENITELDSIVLGAIIYSEDTKLSEIRNLALSKSSTFQTSYYNWTKKMSKMDDESIYFEKELSNPLMRNKIKLIDVIFSIISLIITVILQNKILGIISIIAILYAILSNINSKEDLKRTNKGLDIYKNLEGLKSYMEDFSRLDEKDLPEVNLWGKYLVYAVSLGCADTVYETMNLRLTNMTKDISVINQVHDVFSINHSISLLPKRIDISNYTRIIGSEGGNRPFGNGGFSGGGFSSGGSAGSFGGGHSGGRF